MAREDPPAKLLYCTFCGKSQHEVRKLIAGPSVFICDECVDLCNDILREEVAAGAKTRTAESLPTPQEIVAMLSEYVIGQRFPKEVLAVAMRQHFKRLAQKGKANDGVDVEKSNILLIGPSGSGKTFLAETLAKILNVPFAQEDLTQVTQAGYVGKDVTDVLYRLLSSCEGDVSKAEFGIVFLDEVDKLSRRQDSRASIDVGGGGVQEALLKMIDGAVVEVHSEGGRRVPGQEIIKLNTKNILFILAGAFEGLEGIIEKRVNKDKGGIGFGAKISKGVGGAPLLSLIHEVTPEDLIIYGMDRQFIGRLPVTATLDELDEGTLERILTEPKNAILKQEKVKFSGEGADFVWGGEAVKEIARKAIREKTGARGLRRICTRILHDTFRDLPTLQKNGDTIAQVRLRGEHVLNGTSPELIRKTPKLLT